MTSSTVCHSKCKPIVEPLRAKPKTYRQAPTHWLKFYEEAVIESGVRTPVVQLKSEGIAINNKVCISSWGGGNHNFDSTAQKAKQQHVVAHGEHDKAQQKKVREKFGECHKHKPQPFPDNKRKRKPTNPNKHKSIKGIKKH